MSAYNFSGFEDPSRGSAAAYGNPNANFQSPFNAQYGGAAGGQYDHSPGSNYLQSQPQRAPAYGQPYSPNSPSTRRPGAPTVRPGHASSDSSTFQTSTGSSEEGWDLNSRSRTPSDQDLDLGASGGVPDSKLTQRQLLVREIVRTEHSYVRDLGKVIHVRLSASSSLVTNLFLHLTSLSSFPLCSPASYFLPYSQFCNLHCLPFLSHRSTLLRLIAVDP